jgi:hypothetical protein
VLAVALEQTEADALEDVPLRKIGPIGVALVIAAARLQAPSHLKFRQANGVFRIELRVLGLPWTLKTEIRDYRDRLF